MFDLQLLRVGTPVRVGSDFKVGSRALLHFHSPFLVPHEATLVPQGVCHPCEDYACPQDLIFLQVGVTE